MKKLSYKTLYIAWAVLFVVTAALGFAFPSAMGAGLMLLRLAAVLFFLPPAWILVRAKKTGNRFHVGLIRWLSLASIVLTGVLLVLNFSSVLWSEAVGSALYAALVVVSAPMLCANHYALSLFLWGALLAGTFYRKK
jgi:hypothetical protein